MYVCIYVYIDRGNSVYKMERDAILYATTTSIQRCTLTIVMIKFKH